jgi:alpha-acetolactate decarboxylase
MIRDSNKMKYNLLFFFCLDATNTKNKKMNDEKNEKNLKGTLRK